MNYIVDKLFELSDITYKEFHKKLIPNVVEDKIIGVRVPLIRKFANQLIKNAEADRFLCSLPHHYYDENNLHACIISKTKDFDLCINQIEEFLPFIDNWATCDILRPVAFKNDKDRLLICIDRWLNSSHEYTVRFAIEMLMIHFLDNEFDYKHLIKVASIDSDYYYVNMMCAWYFATALAKQWENTFPILSSCILSEFVHKKSIQKSNESKCISKEHIDLLKQIKNYSCHDKNISDNKIKVAELYAVAMHNGQYRIGGAEYITHPISVAHQLKNKGYGTEYQITGLFHDLLEDTKAKEEEIKVIGGNDVLTAVKRLTKQKNYSMAEYMSAILHNPIAKAVKIEDRIHNLRCAKIADKDFRKKYILETEKWFLGLDIEIEQALFELKKSFNE